MTKRKPLVWFDTGIHGLLPDCGTCLDRLMEPLSVAGRVGIEHAGDPPSLARRTLDAWHAARHQDTGQQRRETPA